MSNSTSKAEGRGGAGATDGTHTPMFPPRMPSGVLTTRSVLSRSGTAAEKHRGDRTIDELEEGEEEVVGRRSVATSSQREHSICSLSSCASSTGDLDLANNSSSSGGLNGFLLQTGGKQSTHLQVSGGSRGVSAMSMKDRYSSFAPEVKEAHLERQFTFTGYDIMTDISPPATPFYPVGFGAQTEEDKRRNRESYLSACKQLSLTPVSFVVRKLNEPVIRARSRGFGPKEARAIAVALVHNESVEELDLADNIVGAEGAKCLAATIAVSNKLKRIDLSENKIEAEGLSAICQAVANSDFLQYLRLSAVGIKNTDLIHVRNMLDQDMSLRELHLTHNSIADDGCVILGKAIADNDTLEVLDLSWNHIRGKGALAIAAGIRDNRGLNYVNLSWNGFGYEGSEAMGNALLKNKVLAKLDMSSNRIHAEAMSCIMRGLKKNTSLTHLNLSNNPLTPQACVLMLQAIQKMDGSNLRELDIWDLVVPEEFMELMDVITEVKKDFKCKHGMTITYSSTGGDTAEDGMSSLDPRALLVQLMEKDGLRIVDLFRRLDNDETWTVSRKEFKAGILKGGYNVTEAQLDELVELLDTNDDGEVDLRSVEMMAGQREYLRKARKAKVQRQKQTEPAASNNMSADRLREEMSMLEEQMAQNAVRVAELAQSQQRATKEETEKRLMEEARARHKEEKSGEIK